MKIAYTQTAVAASPSSNDIIFDLAGRAIYARGIKFDGTQYSIFEKHSLGDKGGNSGLVPVPDYNNNSTNRFLKETGVWEQLTSTTVGLGNVANINQSKAIKSISRSGLTFTATHLDNTTSTFNQQDQNVKQTSSTSNSDIPVLLAYTASPTSNTASGALYSDVKVNPSTGAVIANLFQGSLDWSNIINAPSSFTPSEHTHNTNQITALTGYTKATTAGSLATSDSLNIALGKLEYKAHHAYDWVISVTASDTDKYINKWSEIVGFLDSVKEDTDILDEFVTRKTNQLEKDGITGAKDFTNITTFKTNAANVVMDPNTLGLQIQNTATGGWARYLVIKSVVSGDVNSNVFKFGGHGNTSTTFSGYAYIAINAQTQSDATFKVYSNKVTAPKFATDGGTSSQFVKGDGSLDSNTYVTGGPYLPLAGGQMDSSAYIAWNNGENGNDVSNWGITANGLRIISYASETENTTTPTKYATALHVKGRYGFQLASRGGSTANDFYIKNVHNTIWNKIATEDWVTSLGYTTNKGTITGITANAGLTGGGTSGAVTIGHSNSVTAITTAGLYKFKYDAQGHITGTTAIAKTDITGLGIPSENTAHSHAAGAGIVISGTGGTSGTVTYSLGNCDALSEGTANCTDGTMLLTSYASDDGFSHSNAKGVVYKRKASAVYNYIKGKLDSVYQPKGTYLTSQDHYKTTITAGTAGSSSHSSGYQVTIPYVTMNANGHVTNYGTKNHYITKLCTDKFFTNASDITFDNMLWKAAGACSDVPTMGQASVMNVGNYYGRAWQIWNSRNDHTLYWRAANSDGTAWSDTVHSIFDDTNLTISGGGSSMGSSLTITANETSYTLTIPTISYWSASTSRTKNTVLAAPNGSNGPATFRTLVPADIPNLEQYAVYKAGNSSDANALDATAYTTAIKHIGYGYQAKGWNTTGPAMSFGASTGYLVQLQGSTSKLGSLVYRIVSNKEPGNWYTLLSSYNYTSYVNTTNFPGLNKTGTVTEVKVGTTSYTPSSGIVSLPAYPTLSGLSGISEIIATGTAPLTLSAEKDGTTVTITGSIATGTTSSVGVVKQHKADNCDTYTSDEGATTPAAVKKAIGTFVTVTQNLTSGTKIGSISINGTSTNLYCQTNTNTTYSFSSGVDKFTVTPSGGSAVTVDVGTLLVNGTYTGSGGGQYPSYVGSGKVRWNMMNMTTTYFSEAFSGYCDWMMMDTYAGSDVPHVTMIGVSKSSSPTAYIASGSKGSTDKWTIKKLATTSDIGNGTITINQNGVSKGSFTVNQGINTTIDLTDNERPITNTYTGSDQSTSVSQYGTNALYNALVNGYATNAGTASQLSNTVASDPASAASGQYLKWYAQISQSSGYAGTNAGFPVGSNANGILWMGTHSGPYGGQLGISSNGRIYYRFITNKSFPTTANGGSWNKVAWSSEIPTKVSDLTNDSGFLTSVTKSNVGLGNVQNTAFYPRSTTVNGTAWNMAGTTNGAAFTIYAPTTAGTSGQVLTSSGGTPSWTNQDSLNVNYAYSSARLVVNDVRDTTRNPNYFDNKKVTAWFNNTGTPDSNWYSGIHVKGWTNGYTSWELCSYSSLETANDYNLYFRSGNTTWGSWKTIITSGNIGSQSVNYATSAGNVTGTVAIANGGTGATTAANARTNLGLGAAAVKGVDTTVTSGSTNLITSGGVNTALNSLLDIVDTKLSGYLPLTGGTMTGSITMPNDKGISFGVGDTKITTIPTGLSLWNNVDANNCNGPGNYTVILNVKGYYKMQLAAHGGASNHLYFKGGSSSNWVTVCHSDNSSVSGNTITINGVSTTWTNTTYSTMTAATASAAGKSGLVPAPAANKHTAFLRGDGTWVVPTDTKVNVTSAATTKAYLLGTSTAPTSTATGVTAVADPNVYLTTTAGQLYANSFLANEVRGTIASGGSYSRFKIFPDENYLYIQAASYAGTSLNGSVAITGYNSNNLTNFYVATTAAGIGVAPDATFKLKIGGDVFVTGHLRIGSTNAKLYGQSDMLYASIGNTTALTITASCVKRGSSASSVTLGDSTCRWGGLYSTTGNFSSSVTIAGTLSAQDGKFKTDANGAYWTSDRRVKNNIHSPVRSGLLQDKTGFIRKFTWKDTNKNSYGYIAQELLSVVPEAVKYNEETGLYSVNYDVAHSAAIAQLVIKVKELESEILRLKQLIN